MSVPTLFALAVLCPPVLRHNQLHARLIHSFERLPHPAGTGPVARLYDIRGAGGGIVFFVGELRTYHGPASTLADCCAHQQPLPGAVDGSPARLLSAFPDYPSFRGADSFVTQLGNNIPASRADGGCQYYVVYSEEACEACLDFPGF